jgi:hypothetical protein
MSELNSTPKATTSERRIAANRLNAQASTGPKDTSRTRYNSMTHGLRAQHVVLPGESQEEYQERLETWTCEYDPQSDRERYLITRIVNASWRMDRAVAVEKALARQNRNALIEGQEKRQADALAGLMTRLNEGDASVMREVRMIPAGARWMLAQYRTLALDLKVDSKLMASGRHLAIRLLGKSYSDLFRCDLEVTAWLLALFGVLHGPAMTQEDAERTFSKHQLDKMSPVEFERRIARFLCMLPEKAEALALLRQYIAQAIRGLRAHIQWLDRLAARDLEIALQKARIDPTDHGQKLLKYEKQHEGTFNTAQRQIDKIKNPPPPPRPRAPRGPGKNETVTVTTAAPAPAAAAPAEPVAAPPTSAVAEVTPDASPEARAEPTPAGVGPAEVSAPTLVTPTAAVAEPGAVPVEITSKPISEAGPPETECPGPRTSEDLPVYEPTDEELERDFPEVVAFQRLHERLAAIYGTGATPDAGDSRPRAPANPGGFTSKPISFPWPPPSPPPRVAPSDAVRAPPGSDRDRGPPRE